MAAEHRRIAIEVAAFMAALALVLVFMYRARPPAIYEESRVAMGTLVSVTVFGEDAGSAADAVEAAFEAIDAVDRMMTRYSGDSDVVRLNAQGGGNAEASVVHVLARAVEVAELTDGAFDPTVAPLVDLWNFDEGTRVPGRSELIGALERVGYEQVRIDRDSLNVDLGVAEVDVDGIAKGHAVDQAIIVLRSRGIKSAIVDAGGDIGLLGDRPRHDTWRIGIKDPRGDGLLGVLSLSEGSVATSGDYQRSFVADGVRYHHILDPETGYPARGLVSATVVCDSCMTADALATAVFVMGSSEGMAFIEARDGVEAVLVSGDEGIHGVAVSSGLEGRFEPAE